MESSNAFVVPPRLFSRKRKAPGSASAAGAIDRAEGASHASTTFFTEAGYARFSAYGDAAESALYGDEELIRATCLTTGSSNRQPHAAYITGAVEEGRTGDAARQNPAAAVAPDKLAALPQSSSRVAAMITSAAGSSMQSQRQPQTHRHLLELLAEKKERFGDLRVRADNLSRRLSTLTIPQHERFMQLLLKRIHAQRRGLPAILALSPDEVAHWQSLDASVTEEREELYREFKAIAISEVGPAMAFVPKAVESWYEKMLTHCRNDVFQMYPRYFEPSLHIATRGDMATSTGSDLCVMKHVKEVFSHGACVTVHGERFFNGMQVSTTEDWHVGASPESASLVRHAISADVHAEKLMEKFDCDVAIASSTLVRLFDVERQQGLGKAHEWIVPVKSRVFVNKKGVAKKHVYFDRPIPAEAVSAREKVAEAGRASLLAALQANADEANHLQQQQGTTTRGRTAYHVWELGGRRVLVRCTTHAHLVPKSSNSQEPNLKSEATAKRGGQPSEKSLPLSVFIKPDYRFLDLDEQLTRSEKRRFWLHSWLRGSAVVLIGRLNPQSSAVRSWEKHSLASLVYGHDATHSPELFDPMENFQVVHAVFAATCNVPAGNYLVQSRSDGDIELLMATTTPPLPAGMGESSSDSKNSHILDLFEFISSPRASSSSTVDFVLPKWSYEQGRVPYCFRTGSYCLPFFLDGVCPKIADKQVCTAMHIRRARAISGANNSNSSTLWRFDDYTNLLKIANKAERRGIAPPSIAQGLTEWLKPSFHFCFAAQPVDLANVHAPVQCPKPTGECVQPHLTVHQVLERLADCEMRLDRERKKKTKRKSRQLRQQPPRQQYQQQHYDYDDPERTSGMLESEYGPSF